MSLDKQGDYAVYSVRVNSEPSEVVDGAKKMVVELDGIPSSGYLWHPVTTPDREERIPPSSDGACGATIVTRFIYDAVQPGSVLVFEYFRAWEDVPPIRTVRVTLDP